MSFLQKTKVIFTTQLTDVIHLYFCEMFSGKGEEMFRKTITEGS